MTDSTKNAAPEVSAVIPFYRNVGWLCEAVESVLAQDLGDVEIIVVNDGSPEDVSELLDRFGGRIRYFEKENGGAASARNAGLEQARGKYIAFLDSDDLWTPEKLSVQLKKMKDCGARWSLTDYEVFGEGMEHGKRRVRILKPYESYHAYGDMLLYYGAKNIALYLDAHPKERIETLCEKLRSKEQREWINLGGQLVTGDDVEKLRRDINKGVLNTWNDIHQRYNELWEQYPVEKLRHAFSSLRFLYLDRADTLTPALWKEILEKACQVQQFICDQVYISRKKDYDNPFRNATFRNEEEKIAVIGELDEVSFVKQIREETEKMIQLFKNNM